MPRKRTPPGEPVTELSSDAELLRAVAGERWRPFGCCPSGTRRGCGPVRRAVAAVLTITAALNFAGADLAELLTWIFSSLVLLMNVAIVYSNLTAVKSVEAAFRRKGDPELARVEVAPFLRAAEDAFPHWVRA